MAAPNSLPLAAAPAADPAAQQQAAVTAPRSPVPGFAAAAGKQGATMAAPPSPQGGAPGFAVVPQGAAHVAAPASPQGPPGFWVAPQQGAPAPPQGAPAMAPPQSATMMAQQQQQHQQHFAPVVVPGSQQGMQMQMAVQAASMGMMMASMPLQAQAQAMAAHQSAQGMAPLQSLPTGPLPMMEMQQAQAGYMMVSPPLPLMQQQQPSQADPSTMAQPLLPLGPPPMMLQQQPAQGGTAMMPQPPMPFSSPSVMLQQNQQASQMMIGQPQLSALPGKRQRVDQYDNYPYGQQMMGYQQETAVFNASMGQSYGPNLNNEFPSFGPPMPSPPTDATCTVYVEGLPIDCTRREVAHIFRQYMGFREVRLINKGSARHVMCFVDFATPAHAFLAMRTLQGYKFDEQEPRSRNLNLQFSHSPRMNSHGGC